MIMYEMELLEQTMGTPFRKSATSVASSNGDRRFPPESYAYEDDVTSEAVETIRKAAAKVTEAQEWEVVDGFGYSA